MVAQAGTMAGRGPIHRRSAVSGKETRWACATLVTRIGMWATGRLMGRIRVAGYPNGWKMSAIGSATGLATLGKALTMLGSGQKTGRATWGKGWAMPGTGPGTELVTWGKGLRMLGNGPKKRT